MSAATQAVPAAADAAAAARWRAPAFNFYDARLLGGAWRAAERPDIVREFFRVLSVCHTVIPNGAPLPHARGARLPAACASSAPSQEAYSAGTLEQSRIPLHSLSSHSPPDNVTS